MRNKYPLHIINVIVSVVGLLRDLLYIYKCKETITLDKNIHVIVLEVGFLCLGYSRPEK
jgi:hypothetical protein